jgi:hypothetical protein
MAVRRKQIRDMVESLLARHKVTRAPVPVDKIALAARLGAAAGRARRPRLRGTFTLSLLGCCQR